MPSPDKAKLLVLILLVAAPSIALANAGLPLLLFVSVGFFVFGSVWAVIVEAITYTRTAHVSWTRAIGSSFSVNLVSLVVVGVLLPMLIAVSAIPFDNNLVWAVTTWVYEGNSYGNLSLIMTVVYALLMFVGSIYLEAYLLSKMWAKGKMTEKYTPLKISCIGNVTSYSTLTLFWSLSIWLEAPWI